MYLSPSLGRRDCQSPTESWAGAPGADPGSAPWWSGIKPGWRTRALGPGGRSPAMARPLTAWLLAPCASWVSLCRMAHNGTVPTSAGHRGGTAVNLRQEFMALDGHKAKARPFCYFSDYYYSQFGSRPAPPSLLEALPVHPTFSATGPGALEPRSPVWQVTKIH